MITNIIISTLLLVSTTGLAVSKHYCEGQFVSVELKADAEPCCEDETCCHTETQFIQVENDFLASHTDFKLGPRFTSGFMLLSSEIEMKPVNNGFKTSFIRPFPPLHDTGTRLALHQVYRL